MHRAHGSVDRLDQRDRVRRDSRNSLVCCALAQAVPRGAGVGKHSIFIRDLSVYAQNHMMKRSRRPKVSAIDRPLAESTSSEPSSALPRELPVSTRPAKPSAVADSELDRPEKGRDPTLPENTVHGAPGHQIKEPRSEDEDDEGRSTTEQLIEAGAQEAEQDKVKQATRAAPRSDRS